MPVGPPSSPSGVFLLSEAFSFEKAPVQVPSELPKVSETFLICPLMLGPNITGIIPNECANSYSGAISKNPSSLPSVTSSNWVRAVPSNIDASRSSGLFGISETVQPLSTLYFTCIKF